MTTDPLAIDAEKPSLDVNQIQRLIPHRYPFLMIDRAVNIESEKSILAIKNVSINEPFFVGHFPSHPVMPGVLIVEAMAQGAATLVMYGMGAEAYGKVVYFMSVDSAKFRRPVGPGDVLKIQCTALQNRGAVWKFEGVAWVDGAKVAEATFSAMIRDEKGA